MLNLPSRLNDALEGRYRIERELGAGGMATVYLARDLRHNRSVALKVLKPELAAVVGAERFLAEIETTANLQHPHILPLFDSGEADGFLFYVMPYVEGETLRERIDREKQLPVDEAVRIATAVAGALQAAHDRGIIHRDIKPANILLSGDQPLVADFGIALAAGAGGGTRLTETGLSVGTPYYMSPEQATGDQSVGPASDIFALAAVLYEMLTGDPPYVGSSAQAVLGQIIQGVPVSATGVRKSVPTHVDAAVRKALEKLPADRFTEAREFARALADPGFRHGTAPDPVTAAGTARWRRAVLVLGAAAAAMAGALAWIALQPPPPGQTVRFNPDLDPPLSLLVPAPMQLALSDDGSFLVYPGASGSEGEQSLWIRRFEELAAVPIAGSTMGLNPAISPDGRNVAFIDQTARALQAVPLAGGAPRRLADAAVCCVDWADDGFIYYTAPPFEVYRVPESGGTPERLLPRTDSTVVFSSGSSIQGRWLLFGRSSPDFQKGDIWAYDTATGEEKRVASGWGFGWHLPGGRIALLDGQGTLSVAPVDGRMELLAPPTPVIQNIRVTSPSVAISPGGALAYVAGGGAFGVYQPVWVYRSGRVEPVDPQWTVNPMAEGLNAGFAISPDGSRVAMGVAGEFGDGGDIFIKRLPDGGFSRLTTDPAPQIRPRWEADGRHVTYLSFGTRAYALFRERADGIGGPELVADIEADVTSTLTGAYEGLSSPDGWRIVRKGAAGGPLSGVDIVAFAPGEDTASFRIDSEFQETSLARSPDGGWLAYTSDETGRTEVYIRSFPDLTVTKEQVSTSGGEAPLWSRSGDELFFVNAARELVSVEIGSGEPLLGARRSLFTIPDDILLTEAYAMYDVDVGDDRFMMLQAVEGTAPASASPIVVLNWFKEIGERLGPGN